MNWLWVALGGAIGATFRYGTGVLLIKPSLKYWDVFKPSPDTLMVNRTVSGHYWNLIHLKVNDNLTDLFNELVPPMA